MFGLMQAPNVGVGGKDHGNHKREYCYQVKFFDENGMFLCMEPFTVPATNSDSAYDAIEESVQDHCDSFDYFEYEINLEDVC